MTKVLISISEADLTAIDKYSKLKRYSRSELMVLATLEKIDNDNGGLKEQMASLGITKIEAPVPTGTGNPEWNKSGGTSMYGVKREIEKGSYEETDYNCSHGRAWGLCEHGCELPKV